MTRKALSVVLFLCLSLGQAGALAADEAKRRPNIVFILADDLGWRDLSNEGSTYYESPHIDRIAKEGMKFSRGYATCQVCSPSRASILTGNSEPDRHRNGSVSGRVGWNLSEDFNVDYVFRYIDRDVEIDSFDFTLGLIDDLVRANLSQQFMNRIQLRSLSLDGLIESKVGFSLTDYQRQDTATVFSFEASEFHGQSRQLDWQSNVTLTENQLVTVGVDYLHEMASSDVNPEQQQFNTGVYLQDQVVLTENWFAGFGFRWDSHSAAGNASTYRVSTRYLNPGTARE